MHEFHFIAPQNYKLFLPFVEVNTKFDVVLSLNLNRYIHTYITVSCHGWSLYYQISIKIKKKVIMLCQRHRHRQKTCLIFVKKKGNLYCMFYQNQKSTNESRQMNKLPSCVHLYCGDSLRCWIKSKKIKEQPYSSKTQFNILHLIKHIDHGAFLILK